MATYVIGDVQGCYESFLALLKKVKFSENRDRIWFTGDLVNRGPGSLEMLTWAFKHRHQIITILGNHEIHLLAIHEGVRSLRVGDTLAPI
ncbi:MAG: diadenosine tetraphosphatase, partial [Candidatus Eisenbacteria bacterium]|nr:diadenosine tetraphosphatase [Candidatus Eisenbacteria bacterium]